MFWARCVTNVGKREKLVDLSGLQQRFFFSLKKMEDLIEEAEITRTPFLR